MVAQVAGSGETGSGVVFQLAVDFIRKEQKIALGGKLIERGKGGGVH